VAHSLLFSLFYDGNLPLWLSDAEALRAKQKVRSNPKLSWKDTCPTCAAEKRRGEGGGVSSREKWRQLTRIGMVTGPIWQLSIGASLHFADRDLSLYRTWPYSRWWLLFVAVPYKTLTTIVMTRLEILSSGGRLQILYHQLRG
jgi:hypothetical protein